MRSLLLPGTRALISRAANPERRLAWDLQLLRLPRFPQDGNGPTDGSGFPKDGNGPKDESVGPVDGPGTLACVNTHLPNKIVAEALAAGLIPGIPAGARAKPEALAAVGTRLDFLVELPEQFPCWIEVKNVTLVEPDRPGVAQFPDAISIRGLKHLRKLTGLRAEGHRAVILYLVNRTDATSFAPAAHIDPGYARGLAEALRAGVEALVCFTDIHESAGQWHVTIARVERWTG